MSTETSAETTPVTLTLKKGNWPDRPWASYGAAVKTATADTYLIETLPGPAGCSYMITAAGVEMTIDQFTISEDIKTQGYFFKQYDDGSIWLQKETPAALELAFNADWKGQYQTGEVFINVSDGKKYVFGETAFASYNDATAYAAQHYVPGLTTRITAYSDDTAVDKNAIRYSDGVTIVAAEGKDVVLKSSNGSAFFSNSIVNGTNAFYTVGEGVKLTGTSALIQFGNINLYGTIETGNTNTGVKLSVGKTVNIYSTGRLVSSWVENIGPATITITGNSESYSKLAQYENGSSSENQWSVLYISGSVNVKDYGWVYASGDGQFGVGYTVSNKVVSDSTGTLVLSNHGKAIANNAFKLSALGTITMDGTSCIEAKTFTLDNTDAAQFAITLDNMTGSNILLHTTGDGVLATNKISITFGGETVALDSTITVDGKEYTVGLIEADGDGKNNDLAVYEAQVAKPETLYVSADSNALPAGKIYGFDAFVNLDGAVAAAKETNGATIIATSDVATSALITAETGTYIIDSHGYKVSFGTVSFGGYAVGGYTPTAFPTNDNPFSVTFAAGGDYSFGATYFGKETADPNYTAVTVGDLDGETTIFNTGEAIANFGNLYLYNIKSTGDESIAGLQTRGLYTVIQNSSITFTDDLKLRRKAANGGSVATPAELKVINSALQVVTGKTILVGEDDARYGKLIMESSTIKAETMKVSGEYGAVVMDGASSITAGTFTLNNTAAAQFAITLDNVDGNNVLLHTTGNGALSTDKISMTNGGAAVALESTITVDGKEYIVGLIEADGDGISNDLAVYAKPEKLYVSADAAKMPEGTTAYIDFFTSLDGAVGMAKHLNGATIVATSDVTAVTDTAIVSGTYIFDSGDYKMTFAVAGGGQHWGCTSLTEATKLTVTLAAGGDYEFSGKTGLQMGMESAEAYADISIGSAAGDRTDVNFVNDSVFYGDLTVENTDVKMAIFYVRDNVIFTNSTITSSGTGSTFYIYKKSSAGGSVDKPASVTMNKSTMTIESTLMVGHSDGTHYGLLDMNGSSIISTRVIEIEKNGVIDLDGTSSLSANEYSFADNAVININLAAVAGTMLLVRTTGTAETLDLSKINIKNGNDIVNFDGKSDYKFTVDGAEYTLKLMDADGDTKVNDLAIVGEIEKAYLYTDKSNLTASDSIIGHNAFTSFSTAYETGATVYELADDVTETVGFVGNLENITFTTSAKDGATLFIPGNMISGGQSPAETSAWDGWTFIGDITVDKGVELKTANAFLYGDITINGKITTTTQLKQACGGMVTINVGGVLDSLDGTASDIICRNDNGIGGYTVIGDAEIGAAADTRLTQLHTHVGSFYSGTISGKNTRIDISTLGMNTTQIGVGSIIDAETGTTMTNPVAKVELDNTVLMAGAVSLTGNSSITLDNYSTMTAGGGLTMNSGTVIVMDGSSSMKVGGAVTIDAASSITVNVKTADIAAGKTLIDLADANADMSANLTVTLDGKAYTLGDEIDVAGDGIYKLALGGTDSNDLVVELVSTMSEPVVTFSTTDPVNELVTVRAEFDDCAKVEVSLDGGEFMELPAGTASWEDVRANGSVAFRCTDANGVVKEYSYVIDNVIADYAKADLMAGNIATSSKADVLVNDPGTGRLYIGGNNTPVYGPGDWNVEELADLNSDGMDDVVMTYARQGSDAGITDVAVLLNTSDAVSGVMFEHVSTNRAMNSDWEYLGTADVNNDGIADILSIETNPQGTDRNVNAWILNADGTYREDMRVCGKNDDWDTEGSARIQGKTRILLSNNKDGSVGFWEHNGTNDSVLKNIGNADGWEILGAADISGDGMDDLLFRTEDNSLVAWTGLGEGTYKEAEIGSLGTVSGYELAGFGDFNGDGKADLLWAGSDNKLAYSQADKNGFGSLTTIA